MANLRDGGAIVIGVAQEPSGFIPSGMDPAHAATYNPDDIMAFVNRFASPAIELTIQQQELAGSVFIVIEIAEFSGQPVICRRNGGPDNFLREGVVYYRSSRTVETAPVASVEDMRAILDLAVDKQLSQFGERLVRAGLVGGDTQSRMRAAFDEQLRGL